ncbi:hypothetical protein PRIPAC_95637, partial [Pristionchus pacificus]
SFRMPGNRRPATSSFPSSASIAPCVIIPIDDVDDESDPASALLAATQSGSDQLSEPSPSPSESVHDGTASNDPQFYENNHLIEALLLQRVQEAAETAALNAMSGRRNTVTYGDSDGAAPQSIRVTESMEDTSESDDEETADEEEPPRDRANNVETTPEILRREFNRVRLALRQNRNAQTVASMFSKFLPFALLFLLKLCFEKSSALLSIILGYMVFLIGDKHITSISSSQRGSIFVTLWAIVGHYVALHYVIGVDLVPVLNALILHFQPYEPCLVTLYFVIMSDLAAKHITILVKAVVVSIPVRTMALKRRRRLLQFLEYTSQTFRCTIAGPWWIMYFLGPFNMADSASALTYLHELPVANTLFVCAFIILKVKEIIEFGQSMYRSAVSLLNMVSYGVAPTQEEIAKHDKCSICFENLRFPIKLLCNHIFCEECAEKWLDEKHTCPMCRAQVEEQDSRFFNAATCKTVRIY